MAISKITTGSISDSVAIDTDTLVVDGTNNRVGIGTASPSNPLHVTASLLGGDLVYLNNINPTASDVLRLNTAGNGSGTNILDVQSAGTSRFLVRGDGIVTMPYQPAFYVYNLNFPDSNSAGTASGGSVLVNIGSHYATGTGRFTAPISGTYMFTMMTQAYDSGNTTGQYQTAVFRKNGSNVGGEAYHGWQPNDGNNHVQAQNTIIISLSANDYMQAYVQYGSRDIQNFFSGYLIG